MTAPSPATIERADALAKKHEDRFRLDVLNICLATKVGKEGDLQQAIEILLLDILSFGRECHEAGGKANR